MCDAYVVNRAKCYWTGQDKQLFWKPPKQECCLSSNVAGQKNRESPITGSIDICFCMQDRQPMEEWLKLCKSQNTCLSESKENTTLQMVTKVNTKYPSLTILQEVFSLKSKLLDMFYKDDFRKPKVIFIKSIWPEIVPL